MSKDIRIIDYFKELEEGGVIFLMNCLQAVSYTHLSSTLLDSKNYAKYIKERESNGDLPLLLLEMQTSYRISVILF